MTIEMQYMCLCEEFVSDARFYITESVLNALKGYYAQCIDSNRKLSQIRDLRTLLKILEKRDILSCDNIKPLLYISNNFLTNPQIQNKVKDYENYLQHTQYSSFYNMYQEPNENKNENKSELLNVNESSTSQTKVSNELEDQSPSQKSKSYKTKFSEQEIILQQMLLSCISERIGRSWRDTVRYLGVPEYQIDAIQNKHPFDLKEQSYEALKLYTTQYSNNNWKINLIHALEKARRRDLKELVENLIFEANK